MPCKPVYPKLRQFRITNFDVCRCDNSLIITTTCLFDQQLMTTSIKRNIYMQHEVTIFNVYVNKTLHITRVCTGSIVTMAGRTDRRRITRLRGHRGYC